MPFIREPAVSGYFYPAEPTVLRRAVRTFLGDARCGATGVFGVVAPHAGYRYSGAVAGAVFARARVPSRVIVLAPNHTGMGGAAGSLPGAGLFRTPLGDVPLDEELAAELRDCCGEVEEDPVAHVREHAVEVQLPFIQELCPGATLLPLVLRWSDWGRTERLGRALAALVRAHPGEILIVASSDMNHYEPDAVSRAKDARALEAVRALDGRELLERCARERISMCGRVAVAALLEAARELGRAPGETVAYATSGDATGDRTAVVGYAGVVIP